MARDDIIEELRLLREELSKEDLPAYRIDAIETAVKEMQALLRGNGGTVGLAEQVRALRRDIETLTASVKTHKGNKNKVSIALVTAFGAIAIELVRLAFKK